MVIGVAGLARHLCAALIVWGIAAPATSQEHVTVGADTLFYGDDTEFRNQFREGETIFGAAVRGAVLFDVNERVRLSLGAFGNLRFGGDDAFEQARPVVSLTIVSGRSTFVFGTLQTPQAASVPGPDRTGPHGLLPPLQRETLAFERPYEAGLSWTLDHPRLRGSHWINWQRLNTGRHRERFDAGAAGELRASRHVAVPYQLHIVHEGGQLFASGPVADSAALASGIIVRGASAFFERVGVEVYGLVSRHVPDRSTPERSRNGAGFFARADAERAGWRGHLIVWRGDDFLKDEGDANYLSVTRDGRRYRGVRDYAETGVTRTITPAPGVVLEVSGRLHRIERHYEYSFRVLATASASLRVK
jgi:hypothetical protein